MGGRLFGSEHFQPYKQADKLNLFINCAVSQKWSFTTLVGVTPAMESISKEEDETAETFQCFCMLMSESYDYSSRRGLHRFAAFSLEFSPSEVPKLWQSAQMRQERLHFLKGVITDMESALFPLLQWLKWLKFLKDKKYLQGKSINLMLCIFPQKTLLHKMPHRGTKWPWMKPVRSSEQPANCV